MAAGAWFGLLMFFLGFCEYLAEDSQRLLRFEYKFSFKGPHLVSKLGEVPFWTVGGSKYIVIVGN